MPPHYQSMLPLHHSQEEETKLTQRIRLNNDDSNELSLDNDDQESDTFHDFMGKQMRKRSILVLSIMLLLACTLGHTVTVMYYWDKINVNLSPSSMVINDTMPQQSSEREMRKESPAKIAQVFANEQKTNELTVPSLESETYHNKTLSLLLAEMHDEYADDDNDDDDNSEYSILAKARHTDSATPPPPPIDCQATIMLIRHCEKGDIREHCNQLGFERADYIATLFGNHDEKWPAPTKIYALAAGERSNKAVENKREIETVMPLSKKIKVPIDDKFGLHNKADFTNHLFESLRSGDVCGRMTLISWKHSDIPNLAHRLGCGPDQGCPLKFDDMDFDSAWQIRYSYRRAQYAPYPEAEAQKKKHKPWGLHPEWWIFGKVEKENFDPLAYSKKMGTYH